MLHMMALLWVCQLLQSLVANRTARAEVVVQGQAPPGTVLTQEPQGQPPTARLFVLVLPQKEPVYLVYWLISISSPFS